MVSGPTVVIFRRWYRTQIFLSGQVNEVSVFHIVPGILGPLEFDRIALVGHQADVAQRAANQ